MASVILDFIPQYGYTKLHIFESATKEGAPGSEIELVTVDPDNPPTRYTTDQATATNYWFSIQWEDANGGTTPMSDPVQGGTFTVVNDLIQRTLLRDSSLDERVVAQVAEFIVSKVMGVDDPYAVSPDNVTLKQLEGMTLLVLARSHIHTMISSASSGESYTAGLVSQRSDSAKGSTATKDLIDWLTSEANKLLGISNAFVMVMEDIDPTGLGSVSSVSYDHSRLALTMNLE